jgi:GNAT superfamily N-acetyltransferase
VARGQAAAASAARAPTRATALSLTGVDANHKSIDNRRARLPVAETPTPIRPEAASAHGERPGLRHAHAEDVAALARTLADAFYDDPVFGWLMPDDASRLRRLRRFYAIELRHVGLAQGRTWTSGELVGAAITAPPGAWRVPPRAMLMQGSLFGARVPRAARLLGAVERRHPRRPHYYFAHIGVAPQAQGKGLGSALMRPTLDRCDSEGLPAYLEASSERSAALYARLGFELVSELRVGGSPPLRLMLRPAQSISA